MTPPQLISAVPVSPGKAEVTWTPTTDTSVKWYMILATWTGGSVSRIVNAAKAKAMVVGLPPATAIQLSMTAEGTDGTTSLPSQPISITTPAYSSSDPSWLVDSPLDAPPAMRCMATFGTRQVVVFKRGWDVFAKVIDGGVMTEVQLPIPAPTPGPFVASSYNISLGSVSLLSATTLVLWLSSSPLGSGADGLFACEYALGATATLVGTHQYGSSSATIGDGLALADGGWVGSMYDVRTGALSVIHRDSNNVWSQSTTTYAGGAGHSLRMSLCQYPVEGSVWCYCSSDGAANAEILGYRFTPAGGIEAPVIISNFLAPIPPHGEHPWLVARPNAANKTVVLSYTAADTLLLDTEYSGFFMTPPFGSIRELTLASRLGFVEIGPAPTSRVDGTTFISTGIKFIPGPTDARYERISAAFDHICDATGRIVLLSSPINETDMTRVTLAQHVYDVKWSAAALDEHGQQDTGVINVAP